MSDPVEALIQRTRVARGLPATITDRPTLAKVAALLARPTNDEVARPTNDEVACENCGALVLTARIRIGPSIARGGWRCSNPACSPERDEGAHPGASISALTIITSAPTTAEGQSRASSG